MDNFFWYITKMQKTATETPLNWRRPFRVQFPVTNTEECLWYVWVKLFLAWLFSKKTSKYCHSVVVGGVCENFAIL